MTEAQLIVSTLEREGGFVNNPADKQGATNFGITARAWGIYKGLGRPATIAEVQAITSVQATAFYQQQLGQSVFKSVAYEALRVQLFDYGVNSGTARATRWLQRVLDVPVTSLMDGPTTLALQRDRGPLVNRGLVAARLTMIDQICKDDPSQEVFRAGWTTRALSFGEFAV
jgi:lysozyme family protein